MATEYFRIVNVVLLVTASALVMLLIQLILELSNQQRGSSTERWLIAFFLGLLFLVHPLQVFVTAYIWQRSALMACVFSYASLAVYLAVRSGKCRRSEIGYGLCLAFFICGLLSKENTIILPVAFLLAEIAFFKPGIKQLSQRAFVYFVITLLLLGVLSFLQHPHGASELGRGIFATVRSYYHEVGSTLKGASSYTMSCVVLLPLHHYLAPAVSCSTRQPTSGIRRLIGPAGEPSGRSWEFWPC